MGVGIGVVSEDKTITYAAAVADTQYTTLAKLDIHFAFTDVIHYTYDALELTSVVFTVEGSLDGVNWVDLDSQIAAGDGNYAVRGTGPWDYVRTRIVVTGTGDLNYKLRVGRMS